MYIHMVFYICLYFVCVDSAYFGHVIIFFDELYLPKKTIFNYQNHLVGVSYNQLFIELPHIHPELFLKYLFLFCILPFVVLLVNVTLYRHIVRGKICKFTYNLIK